jgi:hypothetical protein
MLTLAEIAIVAARLLWGSPAVAAIVVVAAYDRALRPHTS